MRPTIRTIDLYYYSNKKSSTNFQEQRIQTFASGARQLVVQLALETISISGLYSFSFTPTTNIGASLLGAEIITFFAPP